MSKMFAFDPANRLSMEELRQHPWFTGELPSYDEVVAEFTERKRINDEEEAQ